MSIKSIVKTGLIGMFLNIPGVYKLMLSRLADNPEALFNILERQSVQNHIPAQLTFLAKLANHDDVMDTLIRNLPVASRTSTLLKLLNLHPGASTEVLNDPIMFARSIEIIASDSSALQSVFDIATLLPAHGEQPADRVYNIFSLLIEKPRMLRSLGGSQKLRSAYLDLFVRSLELSHTDMQQELALLEKYRANPNGFIDQKI